jgi:hypothetical protein
VENQVRFEPKECFNIFLSQPGPEPVTEEIPVAQHEHPLTQIPGQSLYHAHLASAAWLDHNPEFGVSAELDQAEFANLGERPVASTTLWSPKGSGVGGRVGDIQHRSVDPDQTQPTVMPAWSIGPGQWTDDLLEQASNGSRAESTACPTQRGSTGQPRQRGELGCVSEHLSQGQIGQQSHSQHDPQHDPVGQQAVRSIRGSAGVAECLFDLLGLDKLAEPGESFQVHRTQFLWGLLTSLSWHDHSPSGVWCVVTPKYQRAVTYSNVNGIAASMMKVP